MTTEWFFQQLEEWADNDNNTPCNSDCLAEVRSKAIQCVYTKDHTELTRIHSLLSTVGAKLSRRLAKQKISAAVIQAAEIPMLAAVVHGTLYTMEKEDPVHAVDLISHGSKVLSILMEERESLGLEQIQNRWPVAEKPSPSTISRAIAALEEAGFVHRTGATKGRKFRILDKARRWRELNVINQPALVPNRRRSRAPAILNKKLINVVIDQTEQLMKNHGYLCYGQPIDYRTETRDVSEINGNRFLKMVESSNDTQVRLQ